ncbi:hypothetical protein CPB86DRAFT_53088 [Serendipita vermifera]|nr:hypothetical protein CPB86DRAFT_53088 [Serendipita vermifera]
MGFQNTEDVVTVLLHFRATEYFLVTGTVIWFYDILITLDDEASLLWTRGGRFIKALYLTVRSTLIIISLCISSLYTPPRTDIYLSWGYLWSSRITILCVRHQSLIACKIHFAFLTLCQVTGVMVATTIFIVRLYTLFYFNRAIRVVLVGALIASHICLVTFTIMLLVGVLTTMYYSDELRSCVSELPKSLSAFYATPIFIESVVALATLYHAWVYRHLRSNLHSNAVRKLVASLYVDGFLYYMLVLALRLATCILYWTAPQSLIFLITYFEHAFTSTITSRWFLSFRKVLLAVDKPSRSTTTGTSVGLTGATIELPERRNGPRGLARGQPRDDTLADTAISM